MYIVALQEQDRPSVDWGRHHTDIFGRTFGFAFQFYIKKVNENVL